MISFITFDALHTLIRPRAPIHIQYAQVMAPYLGALPPSAIRASFKTALKQLQHEQPTYRKEPRGAASVTDWWSEVIRRTAVGAGADAKTTDKHLPTIVSKLMHRFSSSEGYTLFDDAIPTIRALHDIGIRTGVITNSDSRMRQVFTSFNTTSSIGAVEKLLSPTDLDPFLVSEEEGVEKPHPSIFDTAIRHAGVPATQALHIGDELNADTYGAQNAGWKALLIRRPGTDGDGEAKEPGERLDKVQVIHGLEEVLDFVKMINTP